MRPARRRRTPRRQPGNRDNPAVRAAILEAVDIQIRENNPPEVRLTLQRLVDCGFTDEEARLHIGLAMLFEMDDILRTKTPFDHDRYVAALNRLPHLA